MSLGFDVFGAVAGALGLLGLMPLLAALIYNQRPQQRLKVLQDALCDTEELFDEVCRRGLLPDPSFVKFIARNLAEIRAHTDEYRIEVHCPKTFWQECREIFVGLSRQISNLRQDVMRLRAEISSTSAKEKKRRQEGVLPRADLPGDKGAALSTTDQPFEANSLSVAETLVQNNSESRRSSHSTSTRSWSRSSTLVAPEHPDESTKDEHSCSCCCHSFNNATSPVSYTPPCVSDRLATSLSNSVGPLASAISKSPPLYVPFVCAIPRTASGLWLPSYNPKPSNEARSWIRVGGVICDPPLQFEDHLSLPFASRKTCLA